MGKVYATILLGFIGVASFTAAPKTESESLYKNVTGIKLDKMVDIDTCSKCHVLEQAVLEESRHFLTWKDRHKAVKAKRILGNLNLEFGMRHNQVCYNCHYTAETTPHNALPVSISGISCQTCHGPAQDWIAIHNQIGKRPETEEHRLARLSAAADRGMVNTLNLYALLEACYKCHVVPNEDLINIGGHTAGSNFEAVNWTQGEIWHNFLNVKDNTVASESKRRMMYIIGWMIDFEKSLIALSEATAPGKYRDAMIDRVIFAYYKLAEIKEVIEMEELDFLDEIETMDQRPKITRQQGLDLPAKIAEAAKEISKNYDGTKMPSLDALMDSDPIGKLFELKLDDIYELSPE